MQSLLLKRISEYVQFKGTLSSTVQHMYYMLIERGDENRAKKKKKEGGPISSTPGRRFGIFRLSSNSYNYAPLVCHCCHPQQAAHHHTMTQVTIYILLQKQYSIKGRTYQDRLLLTVTTQGYEDQFLPLGASQQSSLVSQIDIFHVAIQRKGRRLEKESLLHIL